MIKNNAFHVKVIELVIRIVFKNYFLKLFIKKKKHFLNLNYSLKLLQMKLHWISQRVREIQMDGEINQRGKFVQI